MKHPPDLRLVFEPRRRQTQPRVISADWDPDTEAIEIRTTHGNFETTLLVSPKEFDKMVADIRALMPFDTVTTRK
jgi:hypothetical protein